MASTYLTKDFSGASRQTWTWSCWFKRSKVSGTQTLFSSGTSNNDRSSIFIEDTTSTIRYYSSEGAAVAAWTASSAVLRDPSAWYHFVCKYGTTQATATDRIKFYLNGEAMVHQTGGITAYPAQNNASGYIGSNDTHGVGCLYYGTTATEYWDGYMAHVHFTDGTAYDASSFGETDSTTGIWKPKISPSVTYGTNGFFLKFASSGSMGTDSSGNGNNFTVNGSITQTQDTPSNVFATWNPLDKDGVVTLTNGNTTFTSSASGGSSNCNMGMYAGKWYFEVKHTVTNNAWVGIIPQNLYKFGSDLFTANYTAGTYAGNPNLYLNGSSQGSLGGGVTTNDIIMYAVDMDNNQIYIGKNGNWNDGLAGGFDQSDFSNANAYSFNRYDDSYVVAGVNGSGSTGYTHHINFGNGYFGTTAVSTANSDANGYGLFEYSVPSGYYALCTKNIKEFG